MLTYSQIAEVEAIYLLHGGGFLVDDEILYKLRERICSGNSEQHAYLHWLFYRWTFIKKHKYHMPKKVIKLDAKCCIGCEEYLFEHYKFCPTCGLNTIIQINIM